MLKQGEQIEIACSQRCTGIVLPSAAQSATATQEICGVCQHGRVRKVAFRCLLDPIYVPARTCMRLPDHAQMSSS